MVKRRDTWTAAHGYFLPLVGVTFRHNVDDFRFITHHFVVGCAEQLVLAVQELFANALLHFRIGQFTLTGRFPRYHLEDPV